MNSKKRDIILFIIFISLILGAVCYTSVHFNHHHKITVGTIKKIRRGGGYKSGADYTVFFEFQVNGRTYLSGSNSYNLCGELNFDEVKQLLLNKKFPVVYDEKYISNNGMLITLRDGSSLTDFKRPDSLLVYDSILTCKYRADGSVPTLGSSFGDTSNKFKQVLQ